MMSIAGRRVLVRCVLTATPTFAFSVLQAPRKIFKDVDKVRRRFLWAQEKEMSGGAAKSTGARYARQRIAEGWEFMIWTSSRGP